MDVYTFYTVSDQPLGTKMSKSKEWIYKNIKFIVLGIIFEWVYRDSFGVEKDEKQAIAIFEKTAKQGYAIAQNNLGWMYEKGKGVAKDDVKAIEWYAKAAEQGYAIAAPW